MFSSQHRSVCNQVRTETTRGGYAQSTRVSDHQRLMGCVSSYLVMEDELNLSCSSALPIVCSIAGLSRTPQGPLRHSRTVTRESAMQSNQNCIRTYIGHSICLMPQEECTAQSSHFRTVPSDGGCHA